MEGWSLMRRDAPRPRRWLLGACHDGEWEDLEDHRRAGEMPMMRPCPRAGQEES